MDRDPDKLLKINIVTLLSCGNLTLLLLCHSGHADLI